MQLYIYERLQFPHRRAAPEKNENFFNCQRISIDAMYFANKTFKNCPTKYQILTYSAF